MRSKLRLSLFAAAVALAPLGAFAQQMPVAPDGTSVNEPPAAGPSASVDACGNTPSGAFGQTAPIAPTVDQNLNPKDLTGARAVDMSSVSGAVVHVEGNLLLVRTPQLPAAGTAPTAGGADRSLAVVRLPADCGQIPQEGSRVTVVGMPNTDGILDAQTVQSTQ